MNPYQIMRFVPSVSVVCLLAIGCKVPSLLPDHGAAASLANDFVVDLFAKGDLDKAEGDSDIYWGRLASSERDYLAATRNGSVQKLGGNPDSLQIVSHLDFPQTGTIAFYYVATGANGRQVSYLVQVTNERRGLLIRAVLVGEKIPTPNNTSDIPPDALVELISK